MEPVDVRDLLDEPGASRRVRRDAAFEGMATELARVRDDDPVRIDVLLDSVVEGILASGTLSGPMRFRCARCLTEFTGQFRHEVRELFTTEPRADRDEYPIADGHIDLEPMVRDTVVLAMPFAPLCREDCLGLCERCGGDRNAGECSCGPETDPRWSALDTLVLDD
ncbi:MAG TPA: YceD family protein [Actinomycetota bacterium]|nr:YceD family protein [Actinomycetota bacterium]